MKNSTCKQKYNDIKKIIKNEYSNDFDLIYHLSYLKNIIHNNNFELMKLCLLNDKIITFNYLTYNLDINSVISKNWIIKNKEKINDKFLYDYFKYSKVKSVEDF